MNPVFVVKADDKLYLYIKDGKHSIIAPGPKSYNLEKTEYYEQTVKNPDYKFVTVFDNTQQDSLNDAAKLDNSDEANEPSAKAEESPQVNAPDHLFRFWLVAPIPWLIDHIDGGYLPVIQCVSNVVGSIVHQKSNFTHTLVAIRFFCTCRHSHCIGM